MLHDNGIFVTSARRNSLGRTVDHINLSQIKPALKSKKGFIGGIEDQGNYKEGFCFRINANGGTEDLIWVLCCDSLTIKNEWMNQLFKMVNG